jgi:hypothetical protein
VSSVDPVTLDTSGERGILAGIEDEAFDEWANDGVPHDERLSSPGDV